MTFQRHLIISAHWDVSPRGALDALVTAREAPIWRSPHEPQPLIHDTISGEDEVRGRQRLPVSNPEKYYIE